MKHNIAMKHNINLHKFVEKGNMIECMIFPFLHEHMQSSIVVRAFDFKKVDDLKKFAL